MAETNIDETKWMTFIQHYWAMISYSEIIKLYRTFPLEGAFFEWNAFACRNELLWHIDHAYHLSNEIAKRYEIGEAAKTTLAEITALFERGHTEDRNAVKFLDCGIKPFRDKVLGHPLNKIKALLGKPGYEISLNWKTVDELLAKIKTFAEQVEQHNLRLGNLTGTTYKDEIGDMAFGIKRVARGLEDSKELRNLKQQIIAKGGKVTVSVDFSTNKLTILGSS